jgi:hypothetical protein
MGFYITVPPVKGKAKWLLANYPDIQETNDPIFDLLHRELIVAVIENPDFDSAVVMMDSCMVEDTFYRDLRHIKWLVIPKATVQELVEHKYCEAEVLELLKPPVLRVIAK